MEINITKIGEDYLVYRPFHNILPRSEIQMHWISVRLYEMGDWGSDVKKMYIFFKQFLNDPPLLYDYDWKYGMYVDKYKNYSYFM